MTLLNCLMSMTDKYYKVSVLGLSLPNDWKMTIFAN